LLALCFPASLASPVFGVLPNPLDVYIEPNRPTVAKEFPE
jgi:hypothetical protein